VPVSPDLRITGLSRTPGAAVRRVFREDEGRSVLLIPLAERRQQLLGIQWVREASVSRVWPNRIDVRVTERVPQAFVRLPAQRRWAPSIPALIDEDGVILPAPSDRGSYELPVLAGIREDQTHAERATRVRLMKALLADLGRAAEQVAEVDAAHLTNWKIILQVNDRAVTLILGDGEHGKKVQRFLQHWPEIQKRAPNAFKFDLRLADRITAVEEAPSAQTPAGEPETQAGGIKG
jgi:cell division protein FtsQ